MCIASVCRSCRGLFGTSEHWQHHGAERGVRRPVGSACRHQRERKTPAPGNVPANGTGYRPRLLRPGTDCKVRQGPGQDLPQGATAQLTWPSKASGLVAPGHGLHRTGHMSAGAHTSHRQFGCSSLQSVQKCPKKCVWGAMKSWRRK